MFKPEIYSLFLWIINHVQLEWNQEAPDLPRPLQRRGENLPDLHCHVLRCHRYAAIVM
ncbi:hypothetical protein FHX64_000480 [Microbacter margulisiae]|uniref:Uncharacterized protein n=1 Tax=Microbacter margulisiae TaxID=1350067 RepID=A0A7W5H1F5_9PORP|nr:hypothetical protein [Microbacter margulisiae]